MSACEKCWRDASQRALLLGGSVTDHYGDLLNERRSNPCSPDEASGSSNRLGPNDQSKHEKPVDGKAPGEATGTPWQDELLALVRDVAKQSLLLADPEREYGLISRARAIVAKLPAPPSVPLVEQEGTKDSGGDR